MAEDQDYSQLSNLEKIAHKVWKVRVEGYNALSEEFANSRNASDPCFAVLESRSDTLKLLATDANVVAHEQALQLICDYLKFGATAPKIAPMGNSGLISALCEKGLSSARAGSKSRATEALLLMVEVSGNADLVVEHMVPHLDARLPKLVAGTAGALAQVVDEFGCAEVVTPKPIIAVLPKLFGHADRNVRAAATSLAVALYKWLGDGLTTLLFEHLKPVQQRDLKAEFDKVQGQSPAQKRFTAAQQASRASASSEDVEMAENSPEPSTAPSAAFDPYSVMEPQDVLSKLPPDLETQLLSAKWKDRKDALDEVCAVLVKAPRIAVVDYTHLVRLLARCMKDANIQVVQLAANSIECLSRGLQKDFHRYQHMVVAPMLERSKEKKPSVAEALANALDLIFKYSSLGDILDDTLNGMRHKTPQVKISATNYLQRCLSNTPNAPLSAQVDAIMEVGVKLLGESQEPVRQAATEVIGTLMKITGERELKLFLNAVDDNRLAKVKTAFANAEVKAASGAALSARSAPVLPPTSSLSKPATQAIPSKRLATSPAKRAIGPRTTPPVRNLTGRLLISSTRSESTLASPAAPQTRNKEIEALQNENAKLLQATRKSKEELDSSARENSALKLELSTLRDQLELVQKTQSSATLLVKQKDMQISRLNSDLENAKVRIKSLEQSIEMMRLKQSTQADRLLQPYSVDPERRSPFRSPSRFTLSRTSQSELNSGVHRLSIDGAPGPSPEKSGDSQRRVSDRTNVFRENGSEEENWRKAAEVTANLKARIEKMKQRNRMALGS